MLNDLISTFSASFEIILPYNCQTVLVMVGNIFGGHTHFYSLAYHMAITASLNVKSANRLAIPVALISPQPLINNILWLVGWLNWLLNVTFNNIWVIDLFVTAHRCAGSLKKVAGCVSDFPFLTTSWMLFVKAPCQIPFLYSYTVSITIYARIISALVHSFYKLVHSWGIYFILQLTTMFYVTSALMASSIFINTCTCNWGLSFPFYYDLLVVTFDLTIWSTPCF